jgi:competence protein ComFC
MKCLLCGNLSLPHICSICQKTYLRPSIYKQTILNDIDVISFYKYNDIKNLLHTKHTSLGFYIYNILALNSFQKFAKKFEFQQQIVSVAIDDTVKSGYSHTAILNKALKSKNINPLYNKLRAKNPISYSGKSKEFRLLNPRDFIVKSFAAKEIILVDDIITTGSTLTQAIQAMKAVKKEVVCCLTLADAGL